MKNVRKIVLFAMLALFVAPSAVHAQNNAQHLQSLMADIGRAEQQRQQAQQQQALGQILIIVGVIGLATGCIVYAIQQSNKNKKE